MPGSGPYVVSDATKRGRQFVVYSDGTQRTRRVDKYGTALGEWTLLEPVPPEEPEPLQLHVVARHQAEGEPKHWSLYAVRRGADGSTSGQVWQVTGDAEHMIYDHGDDIDLFNGADFAWQQTVNTDLSEESFVKVDEMARSEPPPRAESRKEVTENCQGWTVRLLRRLVDTGIVAPEAVVSLQGSMDPV
ncbi:hypothetical protein F503_04880 [Ophiostoma piceae UAMH 11346]|uniref:Uncharacterized protein n=1 Tax=Ophiostoma piceae (strain UAMH 11346) TaxID=1262450 RepID=S3BU61_OPHP1|nr:hypothetical protein F503_04880 [Ophiostoma piceae UAMH 11346]